jgi:CubicO group peptidase (beta-lactamase class C family)
MSARGQPKSLLPNSAFYPQAGAGEPPELCGTLRIASTRLQTLPELAHAQLEGRDARLFPAITLAFVTLGDTLIPLQRGRMVAERAPGNRASYWRVIPQFGRVWHSPEDGGWSRAAFPLMLVNDLENHAHQGLAMFRYRQGRVSGVALQFVQQTSPYRLRQHFLAWGTADAQWSGSGIVDAAAQRERARTELAQRLPHKRWDELTRGLPAGTLAGFGGPVHEKWRLQAALIRDGTLYYQQTLTPCGDYPYPLEMRFGVRSVMKSIGAPLALLRLAQTCGPYVLDLRIGDYVPGLDPKYRRVRFIDAANMASGFGGTGSLHTHPNDPRDGYLEGDYDAWYTARSHAAKVRQMKRSLRPYPWEPGTVVRYRDQDFYLLGAAIDRFLKSLRGSRADLWDMLASEVLAPIGIAQAPAVRTREAGNGRGVLWLNAGYYPTLDDLGKIALLYQNLGAAGSQQLLHRALTEELLSARNALAQSGDASGGGEAGGTPGSDRGALYKMGFHFTPYVGAKSGRRHYLPTMWGAGESEVILYPNSIVSIRIAKAAYLPAGEAALSGAGPETIRAVDRLLPF